MPGPVHRYALLLLFAGLASAQPQAEALVVFDGRTLFVIRTAFGPFTAAQRAAAIPPRLHEAIERPEIGPGGVKAVAHEAYHEISAGGIYLMSVSEDDARAAGRSRSEVAESCRQALAAAIRDYRARHFLWRFTSRLATVAAAWLLFLAVLYALRGALRRSLRRIVNWKKTRAPDVRLQQLRLLSADQVATMVFWLLRLAALLLALFSFYVAVTVTFRVFPSTEWLGQRLLDLLVNPVVVLFEAVTGYLPNLFFLLVLSVFTYYLLKLLGLISQGIEREAIRLPGFYPEWARPTYGILRFLIAMFALVVAFPYLPGGDSPALRGVSIFIGVLVSIGSGSAMGNIVAGTILTYMRSFRVGDRVKIGDAVGDVVEINMLVTRLRTIKNSGVIIPNAMVLGSHVVNYSAMKSQGGLILNTTVTIGYDAPWRTVHDLLIEAARRTGGVLAEPAPFVFQTSLNDFHVSYEINAHTDQPNDMARIYSDLHRNIQETFNEGGVEIMSPSFLALRDGNAVTIPPAHRPEGYRPPGFRVRVEGE